MKNRVAVEREWEEVYMILLNNVRKIYNKGKKNQHLVLENFNFQVERGEFTAIMGRSGAGKSTVLHIIAALDDITDGSYQLDGTEVKGISEKKRAKLRNEKIGILLQNFVLIDNETALQNVMTPLLFSSIPFGKMKLKAKEALERVGISHLEKQVVSTMSGGEKQRVALARAIVNNPVILLADEPTGALDSKTAQGIMELLKKLNETGTTILIVTHDTIVAKSCKRVVQIVDGKLMVNA